MNFECFCFIWRFDLARFWVLRFGRFVILEMVANIVKGSSFGDIVSWQLFTAPTDGENDFECHW